MIESPVDFSRLHNQSIVSALRLLYEQAFPSCERVPFEELVDGLRADARKLHVVLDSGGTLLAFGISLDLGAVLMLEYLAVEQSRRSHGIGGELLEAIGRYARAHEYRGIVLEVERAAADGSPEDPTRRRIAFYRRNGAELVGCASDYRVPRLDGVAGSLPMSLLWLPSSGQICLQGEDLSRTIADIMTRSYELEPEDPLVRENLETLTC